MLSVPSLTSYFHDVPRYDVFGLDPLHRLPVLPVDFPHLRLVLFKCLDGIFRVTLLSIFQSGEKKKNTEDAYRQEKCHLH